MVVLEESSMLTTGHNQYLQPDYLSPLPTTLDAKKSPLALLAQTCSQIGADSPSKPLISPVDKPSKGSSAASNARSPPAAKLERTRSSPSDNVSKSSSSNLAFKPYETNVVAKRPSSDEISRPASKASSVHSASGNSGVDSANNSASVDSNPDSQNNNHQHHHKKSSTSRSTPLGRKSASPGSNHQTPVTHSHSSSSSSPSGTDRRTPADRDKSSASPRNSGNSPIIRSGMEILGHTGSKEAAAANLQSMYKAAAFGAAAAANSLCCPPGLAENPAFRPPFAGASPFSHHHAAAAALLGYSGAGGSPANNPYLSYARVKTPSGGETLVPVCKDPYCTGCQYSMHNAQMMMAAAAAGAAAGGSGAGACPSGCTQCDHQKYGLMALGGLGPMPPPSLAGFPGSLSPASGARPHVCNWIAGESYCGKRFATSEELLQHLRSHTSLAGGSDPSAATAAALLAGQHSHPLLSPSAALHRAAAAGSYPAPSLSPLSARYHPYGKPPTGPLPASLAASPYSAFNALGPYYSPYAIYGQRIGAAVHP